MDNMDLKAAGFYMAGGLGCDSCEVLSQTAGAHVGLNTRHIIQLVHFFKMGNKEAPAGEIPLIRLFGFYPGGIEKTVEVTTRLEQGSKVAWTTIQQCPTVREQPHGVEARC